MKHRCPSYRYSLFVTSCGQPGKQSQRAGLPACLRWVMLWCKWKWHNTDFLWICKMSVSCSFFSLTLSGKICCYFCPGSYPMCELQSKCFKAITGALFTLDTFTDLKAADTDRQRYVWWIKETLAKSSSKRGEDRRRDGIEAKERGERKTFNMIPSVSK